MKLTQEEFARWRESPVTEWFMGACIEAAAMQKRRWSEQSWQTVTADPMLLYRLRESADAYETITEWTLEDVAAFHAKEEP